VRRSGFCDTCASFQREGVAVQLAAEPCARDERVAPLIKQFRWLRTENTRYLIYLGDGSLTMRMVVVVDKLADPPAVVTIRKAQPLDVLLGKLWR